MELHPKYSPYCGGQAVTYNRAYIFKLSKYCIAKFHLRVNLEIFPPAASLIFKKIHQTLKRNS